MLRNSLLVLGTLLLTLMGVEVFLRSFNYHKYSFRPDWLDPSPYILQEQTLEAQGRSLKWYRKAFSRRLNEQKSNLEKGIKVEKDFYFFKKTSKRRILAIGDSGTFGQGVKREEAWPMALQELSEDTEVFNFGVPGALISDSLYYLRHFLLDFSPDVIVVCLFMANDINQSIYFNEKLFSQAMHLESLPVSWWRRSALFKMIKLAQKKYFSTKSRIKNYEEVVFNRDVGPKELFAGDFEQGEFLTYMKEETTQMQQAYSNLEKILNHFKVTANSIGSRLVFTVIPSRSYLEGRLNILPWFSKRLGTPSEYYKRFGINDLEGAKLDFERPLVKLRNLFASKDITLYDFSESLRKINQSREILINGDDHLNAFGHTQLAKLLNQELGKSNTQLKEDD